jgi:ABC-2 type transport system permease protein
MRRVIVLALKDLLILVRLKSGLFFTFVWPVVVAVMFGYMFAGENQGSGRAQLRIVVVDEDNTEGSRAFSARLAQSGDFVVEQGDRASAENQVRLGQRSAFVVIKPGFGAGSTRMFYGEPRRLEVGSDPARSAEAGMIDGLLMKYAMEDMQRMFSEPSASKKMIDEALGDIRKAPGNASGVAPLEQFLTALDQFLGAPQPVNPNAQGSGEWQPLAITKVPVSRAARPGPTNAFQVTFPQGVVWGIIGCVMSFAVSLVTERVRGTFVRLQMAPLTHAQVLGGKALACFLAISILQTTIFTLGTVLFGVRPGSLPLLVLACVCASTGFVGFMMMIASLGKTEQAVAGAGWAMLMPMAMLGGAMIPQFVMPPWMLVAGNISPIKWAMLGIEGAMWRNFSAAEMMLPCGILIAFGAVCFVIGTRGLREA